MCLSDCVLYAGVVHVCCVLFVFVLKDFVELCGYICWMLMNVCVCVCVLCCQWVHVFSVSEETKAQITMRSWKPPCLMLFQGSCTLQSECNYWNEKSEPIISLLLNGFICSFVTFTCIIYFDYLLHFPETHCTCESPVIISGAGTVAFLHDALIFL